MSLEVNSEAHPRREGLSVEALPAELQLCIPLKTVFVNGRRVPKIEQAGCMLHDGDQVDVVHIMSGG